MKSAPIAPDIRLRPDGITPRGPAFLSRLIEGKAFRGNAAEVLAVNAREFGDLVEIRIPGRRLLQCNHPELVQEMLVRDAPHHHRNIVMQRSKLVLGDGLLTSEEPLHMRQRRLAQPAFHRHRIAAYGEVIAQFTQAMTAGWQHGSIRNVHEDMLLLALRIVGKTLFNLDVENEVRQISAAVDSFMGFLPLAFLPFPELILSLPVPAMARIRRSRDSLDAFIYGVIRERRANPGDRGDLLSMLLAAVDEEEHSGSMTDRQVRDECLTVLLAGHETTASGLTFALWLLATHPEVQDQLAGECHRVLGGRAPAAEDYAQLKFAEQVFAEAMRLYPPVWVTARTAAEDYEYRGYRVRKGTVLLAPQYVIHRDARFYPDPMRFDPSRFAEEAKAARPRLAYFPFGAGNRQCIGEGLAWMEGVLALATIAQQWRLTPAPGMPPQPPLAAEVTLRPKAPMLLRVDRR
uniref:Cytochrome P450 n=1 Tax=Acidobacterium capsulatum TaxID=33075 RepID=A0A7V5CSU2_9BACT